MKLSLHSLFLFAMRTVKKLSIFAAEMARRRFGVASVLQRSSLCICSLFVQYLSSSCPVHAQCINEQIVDN